MGVCSLRKDEERVQLALCDYMRKAYPSIMFRSDGGGLKLPMGLAVKFKKMQKAKAYPDFFVAQCTQDHGGLFIEIKKDRNEVYTKKGAMRESEHVKEQAQVLAELRAAGYSAQFGMGIDHCMKIVDSYITGTDT